jgi:hypothetical protein
MITVTTVYLDQIDVKDVTVGVRKAVGAHFMTIRGFECGKAIRGANLNCSAEVALLVSRPLLEKIADAIDHYLQDLDTTETGAHRDEAPEDLVSTE